MKSLDASASCANTTYADLCTFWSRAPTSNDLPPDAPENQFYYLFAMIQAAEANNNQVPNGTGELCSENEVICSIINTNTTAVTINSVSTTLGIVAAKLQTMAAIQWMAQAKNSVYQETDFTALLTSTDTNISSFVNNIVTIQSDNSNNFYLGMGPETVTFLWDNYLIPFYTYITNGTSPPTLSMTVTLLSDGGETITAQAGVFQTGSSQLAVNQKYPVLSSYTDPSFNLTSGNFIFSVNLVLAQILPVSSSGNLNQKYYEGLISYVKSGNEIDYTISINLPQITIINNTTESISSQFTNISGITSPIASKGSGFGTLTSLPSKTPFAITGASSDFSYDVDLVDLIINPSANAPATQANFGASIFFDSGKVAYTLSLNPVSIQFINNTSSSMTFITSTGSGLAPGTGISCSGNSCTVTVGPNSSITGEFASFFNSTVSSETITVTGTYGQGANAKQISTIVTIAAPSSTPSNNTPQFNPTGTPGGFSTYGAFIPGTSTYVLSVTDMSGNLPPTPVVTKSIIWNLPSSTNSFFLVATKVPFTGTEFAYDSSSSYKSGAYEIPGTCTSSSPCTWTITDSNGFANFLEPAQFYEEYNYFLLNDQKGNWIYLDFSDNVVLSYSSSYSSSSAPTINYDNTKSTWTVTIPTPSTAKSTITFNNNTPYNISIPQEIQSALTNTVSGIIGSPCKGGGPCLPGLNSVPPPLTLEPFAINTIVEYSQIPTTLVSFTLSDNTGQGSIQYPPFLATPNPTQFNSVLIENKTTAITDESGLFNLSITNDSGNYIISFGLVDSTAAVILFDNDFGSSFTIQFDKQKVLESFSGAGSQGNASTIVNKTNWTTMVVSQEFITDSTSTQPLQLTGSYSDGSFGSGAISFTPQVTTIPPNATSLFKRGSSSSISSYYIDVKTFNPSNVQPNLTINYPLGIPITIIGLDIFTPTVFPPCCMIPQNASDTYLLLGTATSCNIPTIPAGELSSGFEFNLTTPNDTTKGFAVTFAAGAPPSISAFYEPNSNYTVTGNYDNAGNYSVTVAALPVPQSVTFTNNSYFEIEITGTRANSFKPGYIGITCPESGSADCYINAGPKTVATATFVTLLNPVSFNGANTTFSAVFGSSTVITQTDTQNISVVGGVYAITINPSIVIFNNTSGLTLGCSDTSCSNLVSYTGSNCKLGYTCWNVSELASVTFSLGTDTFIVDFTENPVVISDAPQTVSFTQTKINVPTVISIAETTTSITFINTTDYPISMASIGSNKGQIIDLGCIDSTSLQIPANLTTCSTPTVFNVTDLNSVGNILGAFTGVSGEQTVFSVGQIGTTPNPSVNVVFQNSGSNPYTVTFSPATITFVNSLGQDLIITADASALTALSGITQGSGPSANQYTIPSACTGKVATPVCTGLIDDLLNLSQVSVSLVSGAKTEIAKIDFNGKIATTPSVMSGYSVNISSNSSGPVISFSAPNSNVTLTLKGSMTPVVQDPTSGNNILFVTGASMDTINNQAHMQLDYTRVFSAVGVGTKASCTPISGCPTGLSAMSEAKLLSYMSNKGKSATLSIDGFFSLDTNSLTFPLNNDSGAAIPIASETWGSVTNPSGFSPGDLSVGAYSVTTPTPGNQFYITSQSNGTSTFIPSNAPSSLFSAPITIPSNPSLTLTLDSLYNASITITFTDSEPVNIYPYLTFNTNTQTSPTAYQNNNYLLFKPGSGPSTISFVFNLVLTAPVSGAISSGTITLSGPSGPSGSIASFTLGSSSTASSATIYGNTVTDLNLTVTTLDPNLNLPTITITGSFTSSNSLTYSFIDGITGSVNLVFGN